MGMSGIKGQRTAANKHIVLHSRLPRFLDAVAEIYRISFVMKLVSFLSFAFGGLAAAQTNVVIGQNYLDEWNGFTNKAQLPAGISLYGNIFDGTLNADSQELLEAYAAEHR